jgi:hypothetical protein
MKYLHLHVHSIVCSYVTENFEYFQKIDEDAEERTAHPSTLGFYHV